MTYAIAAAGTGGHVYPGLAVAEALVGCGVPVDHITFFGGARMESLAVPKAGFSFVELELRGLSRSLSLRNLTLPAVVWRATTKVRSVLVEREIGAVLCMGGYVTVPVGYAARRERVPLFLHEQNAHAGLANRLADRWAQKSFATFPNTTGLDGDVIGNPLRSAFVDYDSASLRGPATSRYKLQSDVPTIGVFGGSLGAAAINAAVAKMAASWNGPQIQIVQLVGRIHEDSTSTESDSNQVSRRVVGFEDRMDLFYAISDLVVSRAGGGLFEIAATGTPMVVVPGSFGGGHQGDNAAAMVDAGAAIVVAETELGTLGSVVAGLLADGRRRHLMGMAGRRAARPRAAMTIASAMMEASHA